MKLWTIRFHGRDERETLARADTFYLVNKEAIGLAREDFFSRLLLSEDGKEAEFVATEQPLWKSARGQRIASPEGPYANGFEEGDLATGAASPEES